MNKYFFSVILFLTASSILMAEKIILPQIIAIPVSSTGVSYYYSVGDEFVLRRIQAPQPQVTANHFNVMGTGNNGKPSGGFDTQVMNIFQQHCVRCHKPGLDKPGVALMNTNGTLYVIADVTKEFQRRSLVYNAVVHSEGVSPMPKGSDKLGPREIEIIRAWVGSK